MTQRRTDAYREDIGDAHNVARGTSAEVQVRSGANAGTGGQGTLLAQGTGNGSAWASSSNGVLTANAITEDSSANATGTAAHYQLNTSASAFLESGLLDGSDGVTIDNASIAEFQTVQFPSWVNTMAYDDGV